MTDRKAQYRERKAKERKAKREAGLMKIELWVPAARAAEIRAAIAQMLAESPDVTTTA